MRRRKWSRKPVERPVLNIERLLLNEEHDPILERYSKVINIISWGWCVFTLVWWIIKAL